MSLYGKQNSRNGILMIDRLNLMIGERCQLEAGPQKTLTSPDLSPVWTGMYGRA